MDAGVNPSELAATLSMVPGYPQAFVERRLWLIVAGQLLVCVTSSVWVSYFLYKKLYGLGEISWKKAVEIMGPIGKRLQNLEKERAVWHCYLEWIEDYCTVYYGLLNYLNTAATDLDKICNNKTLSWKNLSESSGLLSQTEGDSVNEGDSRDDREANSGPDWDKITYNVEANLFSSFLKASSAGKPSDLDKTDQNDSTSATSCGLDSKKDAREEEATSEVPDSDCSSVKKKRKRHTKKD